VATYPKLPPAASTKHTPAPPLATDYQQTTAPPLHFSTAKAAMPADTTIPEVARYGHDANYHWLVGTLDYSRIQDAWLLRYVSLEDEDRYGGCVTLVAPGQGVALKSGQTVRVEGVLIDPNSQQLRPAFQVRNIRVVGS
jgi:hypothetical protein